MKCPKCNTEMGFMVNVAPIHFKAYSCPKCGFNDVELLEEMTDEFKQRFNAFYKEISVCMDMPDKVLKGASKWGKD